MKAHKTSFNTAAFKHSPNEAHARSTTKLSPIGRIYLIEVGHRDGSYFVETGALPRGKDLSVQDGFDALMQQDDAIAVWELSPAEGSMRDVSEDMARKWLDEFEGEECELPDFITDHLSDSELEEHFDSIAAVARYSRELASPQAMGRI